MFSSIFNRPPGTPFTAATSRSVPSSAAAVLRLSECPKGPSPAPYRSAAEALISSGCSKSPTLPAFVAPASSSSSSVNFGVNLTYLPVQELVQITQMIHSERERTAEVERELKQVQRLSRASDHELRVGFECGPVCPSCTFTPHPGLNVHQMGLDTHDSARCTANIGRQWWQDSAAAYTTPMAEHGDASSARHSTGTAEYWAGDAAHTTSF